jgi:hypothetical protein
MNGLARLIALSLVFVAITATSAPKSKTTAPAKPTLIAQAHERVKDALKDPESARFKSDFIGKEGAVCGLVNAKNSYGGYGGFERYIVTADRVQLDGDEQWKMDSRWEDLCADFEPRA